MPKPVHCMKVIFRAVDGKEHGGPKTVATGRCGATAAAAAASRGRPDVHALKSPSHAGDGDQGERAAGAGGEGSVMNAGDLVVATRSDEAVHLAAGSVKESQDVVLSSLSRCVVSICDVSSGMRLDRLSDCHIYIHKCGDSHCTCRAVCIRIEQHVQGTPFT